MDEEILNKKLEEFEALRQTYLALLYQKQKIEEELLEVDNAIKELENMKNEENVFVMIGNVLIRKNRDSVMNELKERRDVLDIRIKSLDKQEVQLRERLTNLQNEIEKLVGESKKNIK